MPYHHLNVQSVLPSYFQCIFCGPYPLPRSWIVLLSHRICIAVLTLLWLINDFQHAHVSIVAVRVDDVCHPFKELVGTFILVVNIEARRRCELTKSISHLLLGYHFHVRSLILVQYLDYRPPELLVPRANQL